MTEIETRVIAKNNQGDIVSADIMLYNDDGNIVKKMTIIESEILRNLQETIANYEVEYISLKELNDILQNTTENIEINATKFSGLKSDEIALREEIPTKFDPEAHDTETTRYGPASKNKYGHVKLRDNLNASNYANGEALSSFQGAILDKKIFDITNSINSLKSQYYANSLKIKFGREVDNNGENGSRLMINKGEQIYVKLYCDKPNTDLTNKKLYIIINGVSYERTTNNDAKAFLQINLGPGTYIVSAVTAGADGVNGTSEQKILIVN